MTKSKIKSYFTKQNIAIAIACLVLLFEVGRFFYGKNEVSPSELLFKRDMENLKKNDAARDKELITIRQQRANDSMQLQSIKYQVENVPHIINQITNKYEKDRRNLANQPVDSRLQFFTDWITQEDSSSNRGNSN